jgi:hypothetical protein
MCTYDTVTAPITGSAKGPGGQWFRLSRATVYYDHPVHALAGHALNIDLADPAGGPAQRIALELPAAAARELVTAIERALAAVPPELLEES